MVLTVGEGEGEARSRMTYSRQPGGATWAAQYDFTYRPARAPQAAANAPRG